jgi:uncharacterized protein YggU (UPF0235/DUF167 family)
VSFWRAGPDGITIMVKVHPKSRRPGLKGTRASEAGERLQISVTEAVEDGKANRAVCDLVAGVLGEPRSSVRIVTGATSREKLLAVTGDCATLVEKLRAL